MSIRSVRMKDLLLDAQMLCILFPTTTILLNNPLGEVLSLAQWGLCLYAFLLLIKSRRLLDGMIVRTGVYFALLILSTVLGRGDLVPVIRLTISAVGLCMTVHLLFRKHGSRAFESLRRVIFLLTAVNLLLMVLVPGGVTVRWRTANEWTTYPMPVWLFGMKNNMFPWLFLCNAVAQFDLYGHEPPRKRARLDNLMILLTLLTALLDGSMGTLLSLLLMSAYGLVRKGLRRYVRYVNTYTWLAALLIGTVLIMLTSGELVSGLTSLLGKSTTLSGRTTMWMRLPQLLSGRWILGRGYITSEQYVAFFGNYAQVNMHNTYFDVLAQGGVVLLGAFLAILLGFARMLMKRRSEPVHILAMWLLLALMMEMVIESMNGNMYLWLNLCFIYYVVRLGGENCNILSIPLQENPHGRRINKDGLLHS